MYACCVCARTVNARKDIRQNDVHNTIVSLIIFQHNPFILGIAISNHINFTNYIEERGRLTYIFREVVENGGETASVRGRNHMNESGFSES